MTPEISDTHAFDAIKVHEGQPYSGMPVGRGHQWTYQDGVWRELKLSPDKWGFTYESEKKRYQAAPEGSGASVGSEYHWFILAHQFVRKVDADTYTTRMVGSKYKVAHKRPHWLLWSCEYPGQVSEADRVQRILMAEAMDDAGIGRRTMVP